MPSTDFIIGGNIQAVTQNVTLQLDSTTVSTVAVQVSGTFSATLIFEQSADNGVHYTTVATITSTGLTSYPVAAMTTFRVRCSAYTSGVASVNIQASSGVDNSSSGATSDVNIVGINGTPPALSNPLPVELSDGTNPVGTVSNPLTVNVASGGGSNASVGLTGAAVPLSATQVGGTDGTDLRALLTDTAGQLKILVENASAIPVSLPVGQAVELLDSGGVNKASISAAGAVKVDGSAVTQPVSGTVAVSNFPATQPVSGTVTANQGTAAAVTAGWPTTAGQTAESTAAWTNATAGNTALTLTVQGYNTVTVSLNQTTTITGGQLTFEVSDTVGFTNAYTIVGASFQLPSSGSSQFTDVYTLTANINQGFVIPVAGWAAFRVRLSTAISGTATVNVGIVASNSGPPISNINLVNAINVISTAVKTTTQVAAAARADNILSTNVFGDTNNTVAPLYVADAVYGGAFSGSADTARQGWSKMRTPTVFKTVQATASGNTAVWTPGTGNKFRILKVLVQVTDNASLAAGGVLTVSFQDSATPIPLAFDLFVPTTAVTTVVGDGLEQQLDLGAFGILSAAANNVLNVNLSAALSTGNVRVIAMGTEE